eukprot:gene23594-1468_t
MTPFIMTQGYMIVSSPRVLLALGRADDSLASVATFVLKNRTPKG